MVCPKKVLTVVLVVLAFAAINNHYYRYYYRYRCGGANMKKRDEKFLVLPPYWNMPTRSTRNMSYDIRGDPPIYPRPVGPWNISPLIPRQRYMGVIV